MAEVKHGSVAVTLPDSLTPPPEAGKMTPEEVQRLPKARRGIGLVGQHVADAIVKLGPSFILPAGVTAETLLAACERAEGIDQVLTDLGVIEGRLKQANLLWDAEAWQLLLKINDQVKAQLKHDPEIAKAFSFLIEFMSASARKGGK
jgi:hypothetical protein